METNYPIHIKKLIEEVEAGGNLIETLLAAAPALASDSTLYSIYLYLGYSPHHGSFTRRVTPADVLSQLHSQYSDAVPPDVPLIEDKPSQEPAPVDDAQLKEGKGLKNLSLKVKEIICRKSWISYKQVAEELIREMGMYDNEKEAKNIFRRVYDALNVLISVGIIVKDKKRYIWKGLPILSESASANRRLENQQKRKELLALATKYYTLRELIKRNQEQLVPEEVVRMPFIVVTPESGPTSSIKIDVNRSGTCLTARYSKPIQFIEDQDVVAKLLTQTDNIHIPPELLNLLKLELPSEPIGLNRLFQG